MLRQKYWLFEYISISQILLKAPMQYARSFLLTETDENDATYFIIHQMKVVDRAIKELHAYIDYEARELESTEALINTGADINHRQQALIAHALRHPSTRYTVQAHQQSHKIVYETARRDLIGLAGTGWLNMRKSGKPHIYSVPADLAIRVQNSCKGSPQLIKSNSLSFP